MSERFLDSVVWITGGGSGIGKALAIEFARQGADVAVSGRRADRLRDVVGAIEDLGRKGLALPCDVTDEAALEAAVESVVSKLGKLDVAVANAGFSLAGRIDSLTFDDWRRQLDVNVIGLAITARHAVPELRKTGGRMVLVGSVSGMLATPGYGAYSASKYAVRAIGQTLSMELAPFGVSCTNLQPGFVESEINQVDNSGQFHDDWKDKRPQKLMWKADKAARVCVRAVHRRKREFTFTGHGKFGGWMGRHAPGIIHFAMTRSKGIKRQARDQQQKGD
jgi:NAD(P)-dependent dehydrogenase (short-subunit alcohol dehydrogenase family)